MSLQELLGIQPRFFFWRLIDELLLGFPQAIRPEITYKDPIKNAGDFTRAPYGKFSEVSTKICRKYIPE